MSFKPFKFDPIEELGLNIPKENRRQALEDAAQYLKEAMLDYIGEGKPPVAGGRWIKSLSPKYLEKKKEESTVKFANLEETGHLLDNLSVDVSGNKIVIDVDKEDYGKAEGHLTGIYGVDMKGKPKPRQFMPQGNETFKNEILKNLKKILEDYEE